MVCVYVELSPALRQSGMGNSSVSRIDEFRMERGKVPSQTTPRVAWELNEAVAEMRAAQRKLCDLLHTLSYESRESLLQMAGLGASRVEKILQMCEEVGRPLGVQDVLGIPRMGPGTVGSLVGDPLLPAVVKYVLYYQKVVGQNKCTAQEVGRL